MLSVGLPDKVIITLGIDYRLMWPNSVSDKITALITATP